MKIASALLALYLASASSVALADTVGGNGSYPGTGGGGGATTIADPSTPANKAAVGPAGTNGAFALSVQGVTGGVAQPVSGTFWQATQPTSLATLPSLAAGSAAIGQVGGKTGYVTVSPTVTAAAYTAGNEVGGLETFSNVLLGAGSGVLVSISVTVKSAIVPGFSLLLFSSNPSNTTWTDKTAASINVADIPKVIGDYQIPTGYSPAGAMTIYNLNGIGQALNVGATTLYAVLFTSGTPTFGSTSAVSVTLGILQD